MTIIPKYTMGISDRFSRQGQAQLSAMTAAKELLVGTTLCGGPASQPKLPNLQFKLQTITACGL